MPALAAAIVLSAGHLLVAPAAEARAVYRSHHGHHRHVYRGTRRYYGRSHRYGAGGPIVAGAALGLLGAAIMASRQPYYGPYYYYRPCYGLWCDPYYGPRYGPYFY